MATEPFACCRCYFALNICKRSFQPAKMFKTKILFLGPCETGKTTIANYLADASEVIGGQYRPTQGVRILEFESNGLEINGRNISAEVELWDCSGDKKSVLCIISKVFQIFHQRIFKT